MPPLPGFWQWHSLVARHIKSLKTALQKVSHAVDAKVAVKPQSQLEALLVRNTPKHPLHPLARIRQSQSRWFTTARSAVRHFASSPASNRSSWGRAPLPQSRIASYIAQSSGRAPFASTLRPNLTGGTLGRTAGGYTLGSGRVGGTRYFSHGPASQAQVVQNVSQAVRAFFISGQKAQYDGVSPTGERRYKSVSSLQRETSGKLETLPRTSPGSRIEFSLNPTITALTSLDAVAGYSRSELAPATCLTTEGLMDVLSVDFSRALTDLGAVLNDLKRLSALGDLSITYEGSALCVHFPGCDAGTVERLCDEMNVGRGTVFQDASFDAFVGTDIALLFPFAPSTEASSLSNWPPVASHHEKYPINDQDWGTLSAVSPSAPHPDSELADLRDEGVCMTSAADHETFWTGTDLASSSHSLYEYQGFEGICRFIEQLDAVRT